MSWWFGKRRARRQETQRAIADARSTIDAVRLGVDASLREMRGPYEEELGDVRDPETEADKAWVEEQERLRRADLLRQIEEISARNRRKGDR